MDKPGQSARGWPVHEPDVVFQSSGWRYLGTHVKHDQQREALVGPGSVLGGLTQVLGAILLRHRSSALDLQLRRDLVMIEVDQAQRPRVPPSEPSSEGVVVKEAAFEVVVELGLGHASSELVGPVELHAFRCENTADMNLVKDST